MIKTIEHPKVRTRGPRLHKHLIVTDENGTIIKSGTPDFIKDPEAIVVGESIRRRWRLNDLINENGVYAKEYKDSEIIDRDTTADDNEAIKQKVVVQMDPVSYDIIKSMSTTQRDKLSTETKEKYNSIEAVK